MSFGFGGAAAQGSGGQQAKSEADLQEILTEQLGFKAIAGEDKLRLLPTQWPADNQPAPSASLLSIASSKGLVAAVGPDVLVLASTEGVRKSLKEEQGGADSIKSFTPQATIPLPGRISQVAFSSDESCLVLAAEQGGLAVYDTNALVNGGKESAFQIDTKGAAVRQLLPNPNPSNELAHMFAIVLESGQLLMADLKKQSLLNNTNGNPVFHENVMCACWSRLGKQVVAGRKDGTAVQVDPQGNVKAEIPVPPRLPELSDSRAQGQPLTSIYWLETNDFLLVHSPVNPTRPPTPDPTYDSNGNMQMAADPPTDDSKLHIASRESAKSNAWTFRQVIDPAPAAISRGRIPAYHFMQRLKDWPPDLDDMMIMVSTISSDIGMITKSKIPLDSSNPVTGVFTTTAPPDHMRAAMPMSVSEDMDAGLDTSAIGMSMDLSARELIPKPIDTDETMDESPVPLPALYVLNHEGILCVWWILYNASLRQKTPYPDLIAAGGPRPLEQKKEVSQASPAAPSSPFGAAPPSQIPRPQSSAGPAFGAPSTPGFGGTSAMGNRSSPWGGSAAPAAAAPSAFGKPAFGSSTQIGGGGGFGSVGGMGMNKPSVWGAPQNQQTSQASNAPSFGKPSTPFGGNAGAPSAFASFANKDSEQKPASSLFGGGKPMSSFGGVGFGSKENKPSPFASASQKPAVTAEGSFGSTATLGSASSGSTVGQPSLFGTPSQNGSSNLSFGKPSLPTSREETMVDDEPPVEEKKQGGGLFGGQGFKLGSTFKGDGSAKDDLPKPKNAGSGFFGGAFGNALNEANKQPEPTTPIKKEPGTDDGPQLKDIPAVSTTPATAPKQEADPLTYKPKRFAGDIPPMDIPSEKSKEPDPLNYKPKRFAGDVPPSDIPAEKPKEEPEPEAPLAGSPPVDLGNEKFSERAASENEELPEGPPDDDDEEGWEEEDEEGAEGAEDAEDDEENDEDDEDDDDEDDEDEDSQEITDPKALAAFEARFGPRSPERQDSQAESTTPATQKKASYTPAGFPKAPIAFPPPANTQESPRSPSPVRSAAPLSKPRFGQPSQSFTPQPQRIAVPPAKPVERPSAPTKPAEPEAGDLEDEEDARIQAILDSDPEPTRELPQFLAHQNYAGSVEKPGIGGQIEKVYRDVNSMITTLGLNAHSLQGFVDGHTQSNRDCQRTRADLQDANTWALDEVDDLVDLQGTIEQDLEDGKLEDVRGKVENLRDQEKEVNRFRTKTAELRKQIAALTDPKQRAMQHAAPLPVESQAQQSELRHGVQRVQKLLGQVEEAMSLLRADLSSMAATNDSQANGSAKVPTVEAVTNTILKMTAMIEKKSGDIDVLEAQIKRLPKGIASLNLNADYEDQLVAFMVGSKMGTGSGSPYTTPGRSSRTRMLANGDAPGMSGMFGSSRFRTPPSALANPRHSAMFSPEASMLGRSTGSMSGSARKKMGDVTDEEVRAYHAKTERRRKVLGALKKGVERNGVRVVRLE